MQRIGHGPDLVRGARQSVQQQHRLWPVSEGDRPRVDQIVRGACVAVGSVSTGLQSMRGRRVALWYDGGVTEPTRDETAFSTVLVVDDEEPLRHMLDLLLRREGLEVPLADSAEKAVEILGERGDIDVVISDVRMPGMGGLELVEWIKANRPDVTVIVMSAFGSVELALDAMHRGAYDYVSKPFKQDEVILALRKAEERQRLRRENAVLRAQLKEVGSEPERLGDMLILSPGMKQVARTVRKVAPFKTTVLVLGESGVGKELISRGIHSNSPRVEKAFVAVNCGAIPEALLESELFGHVKGAFTDASSDKPGLFVEAEGGTLFLDEVGELPVSLQVKLLRALQEEEIRPVGGTKARKVDVRVVAATSRDLSAMVEEGSFRQDLFYRLNVMPIEIPPLRERKDDIEPLLRHFVEATNRKLGTKIAGVTEEALKLLRGYDWPGNVRELENTVEHAAVMADAEVLDVHDLPERARRKAGPEGGFTMRFPEDDLSVKRAQRALEREFILRALEETGGNRTHAAKLLDLSHRALLYKIKDFGLA
jgi:two-component system response regulator AtoC